MGDAEEAAPTVRAMFFDQRNVEYLRTRLDRSGLGRTSATRATRQVYTENPGEMPSVEILGGNIPDTSRLCGGLPRIRRSTSIC